MITENGTFKRVLEENYIDELIYERKVKYYRKGKKPVENGKGGDGGEGGEGGDPGNLIIQNLNNNNLSSFD